MGNRDLGGCLEALERVAPEPGEVWNGTVATSTRSGPNSVCTLSALLSYWVTPSSFCAR